MQQILLIGVGGFFGSICRFLVSRYASAINGTFPYGTLFVNVTGSFLLAFISYSVLYGKNIPPEIRSLVSIGFIGAYTTMSTFSYETMRFLDQGEYLQFFLNMGLNIFLCFLFIALGRYFALLSGR